MFSPETIDRTAPRERPGRRSWRDTFRQAADLAVAFATLADSELDEPGSSCPRSAIGGYAPHPHRRPLRPRRGARRPGAGAPRAQACTTPVGGPAYRRLGR